MYIYNVSINDYYYYYIISIYINSNLYVVFSTFDSQNRHIFLELYTWACHFAHFTDQEREGVIQAILTILKKQVTEPSFGGKLT